MIMPINWEEETKLPLMTSCKQAARLASLSFERKLTFREFLTMRLHLFLCKTCTFYMRQITALRRIFLRHEEVLDNTPPAADECLTPTAKQRMKELIEKQK